MEEIDDSRDKLFIKKKLDQRNPNVKVNKEFIETFTETAGKLRDSYRVGVAN